MSSAPVTNRTGYSPPPSPTISRQPAVIQTVPPLSKPIVGQIVDTSKNVSDTARFLDDLSQTTSSPTGSPTLDRAKPNATKSVTKNQPVSDLGQLSREAEIQSHPRHQGSMTFDEATSLLKDAPEGTWLVRYDAIQGQSAVAWKADGKVNHALTDGEHGTSSLGDLLSTFAAAKMLPRTFTIRGGPPISGSDLALSSGAELTTKLGMQLPKQPSPQAIQEISQLLVQ